MSILSRHFLLAITLILSAVFITTLTKTSSAENLTEVESKSPFHYYAIIITNSKYAHFLGGDLITPQNDGERLKSLFDKFGWKTAHLSDLGGEKLLPTIDAQMGDWIADEVDDRLRFLLIYYAGHGINLGSQNFIIPVDYVESIQTVEFERVMKHGLIPISAITEEISFYINIGEGFSVERDHVLFVIDACRNIGSAGNRSFFVEDHSVNQKFNYFYSTTFGTYANNWSSTERDFDSHSLFADEFLYHLSFHHVNAEKILNNVAEGVRKRSQKMSLAQYPELRLHPHLREIPFSPLFGEDDLRRSSEYSICSDLRPLIRITGSEEGINQERIVSAMNQIVDSHRKAAKQHCDDNNISFIPCSSYSFEANVACQDLVLEGYFLSPGGSGSGGSSNG